MAREVGVVFGRTEAVQEDDLRRVAAAVDRRHVQLDAAHIQPQLFLDKFKLVLVYFPTASPGSALGS